MKNEILNVPNESISDTNFEEQIENNMKENEVIDEKPSLNIVSDNFNTEENKLNNNNNNNNIDTTMNCLALTVREDYNLAVTKNFFKKSFRVSWKVALSIFTINFLNMFF